VKQVSNSDPIKCILVKVLRDLDVIHDLSLEQWDLLIRQARRTDLLGRLAVLLREKGMLDSVPEKPRDHLIAIDAYAKKHLQVMKWEIECILQALCELEIPVIFLKGAAYVLRELPPARGRVYADVDIMVPKSELNEVEKTLMINGWSAIKLDDYDQRYYRKWMHEIPPLRHRRRSTVIDVHHRILPETTKAQPDPLLMFEKAEHVKGNDKVKTLHSVDMILHSAVHLFYEGEFDHGLRDLVDLDDLFCYYATENKFWERFLTRAVILEQKMPAYYAVRYCNKILGTPLPAEIWQHAAIWKPGRIHRYLMDLLFLKALMPDHASCNTFWSKPAKILLYIRSHYLRMPFYLLIPHLLRKAFLGSKDKEN